MYIHLPAKALLVISWWLPDCPDRLCTIEVPTEYVWGTYAVWGVAGIGPYFGKDSFVTFLMESGPLTLTSPASEESIAYAQTVDLVFNMPVGAYWAVLNVYNRNGFAGSYFVLAPDCPNGVCTIQATAGTDGAYYVWASSGWGGYFRHDGDWSSFTMQAPDTDVLPLDVLGNAAADAPALDTGAVEAPVDVP